MSQAPAATVAPSSYVAPAPQAPAPQAQTPAPQAYQVGTSYPQAVPQAAPSYQSNPTQYAPQSQPAAAPEGNPWESAFNKVMNVLSTPVQSPFQGQLSQTATQYGPANYGQVGNSQATPASAPQTSSVNQAYSANSSQTSSTLSSAELDNLQAQVGMSNESRQVMDAFGIEAPAVLNQYALNLEEMVDSAVQWGNQAQGLIKGYADFAVQEHQENLAYNEILTNPDVLSDYTLKYFGPEGPCPVYENEQQLETQGYPTAPVANGTNTSATTDGTNFPAPPQAAAPQQPENFWGSFNDTMSRDPQNAWRMLNQAQPNTVQNKLFVME
jgi:hypothetical protein